MISTKHYFICCAALAAMAFTSCSDPVVEDVTDNPPPTTDTTAVLEVESDDMEYMLPSPLQIAEMLTNAGLEYNSSVMNPSENSNMYATNSHKLLNFGVYSADLSYCLLNGQTQETLDYLKVLEGMSDDLGLSSVFDTEDLTRTLRNNSTNQDSLIQVLIGVQERLDAYLDDNDERPMQAVIISGAWVEFMYFGANSARDQSEMNFHLSEQMTLLESLIKGLTSDNSDERINQLASMLNDLSSTYKTMDSVVNSTDASGIPQLSVEELNEIGMKIEQIRKSIVEG